MTGDGELGWGGSGRARVKGKRVARRGKRWKMMLQTGSGSMVCVMVVDLAWIGSGIGGIGRRRGPRLTEDHETCR